MPADPTQHQQLRIFQHLFRLDIQRSAIDVIFNNKTFISRSSSQTNTKYRHSRKLINVRRNLMRVFIFFVVLIWASSADAQSSLERRLKSADTVLLISHSMTSRSTNRLMDSAGNEAALPDLASRSHLNDAVVIERKVLTKLDIAFLSKILTYTYRPTKIITQAGCFDPHHAIIIKEQGKTSFIDLCFHCMDFEASKDIKNLEIRADKWEKLYRFFKDRGFKYEMYLEQ